MGVLLQPVSEEGSLGGDVLLQCGARVAVDGRVVADEEITISK